MLICGQADDEEVEEDAPLEKRKKMFTKECKTAYIIFYCKKGLIFLFSIE